jgi:hypothetical protein
MRFHLLIAGALWVALSVIGEVVPFAFSFYPPGELAYLSLEQPNAPAYACSIHPSGEIGLQVQPRGDLRLTAPPTLALGLPAGLVLSVNYVVMSRMRAS